MNPYQPFVSGFADLIAHARTIPLGSAQPGRLSQPRAGMPTALIFSPHPDDEVIVGGLALRLLRESGWQVINVAVTQGSNRARQAARWEELKACCAAIGFGLRATQENGLEGVNLKTRHEQPARWQYNVDRIAAVLRDTKPKAILFPHAQDWNSSHIGTHYLVADTLAQLDPDFSVFTVETEFWGAMDDPNLMLESTAEDVADLIAALSHHVGEVQRNPYHLRFPAWLIDNVRRGGELVGGQGGAAPDFTFATLYRLRGWRGGQFVPVLKRGRLLSCSEDPGQLFA